MQLKPTRRIALAAASAGLAAVSLSGCLIADNVSQVITIAGSDTTQDMMAALAAADGMTDWSTHDLQVKPLQEFH